MHKREFDLAIADFDEAIRIDPSDANTYISRAASYSNNKNGDKKENSKKAINDYMEAIRLGTDMEATVHYNLGVAYSSLGDKKRAIAEYTESIRLNPNDVRTFNNRGSRYFDTGEFDKAIEDFTKAIKMENYHMAYSNLGMVLWLKGDFDKAIENFTEAIRLLPDKVSFNTPLDLKCYYHARRGLAYFYKGDLDRAAADQAEALRLKPDCIKDYEEDSDDDDMYNAIFEYSVAIWLKPDSAEIYFKRGNVYERAGDFEKAVNDWEAALRLNPDNTEAQKKLEAVRNNAAEYKKGQLPLEKAKSNQQKIKELFAPLFVYRYKEISPADAEKIELFINRCKEKGVPPKAVDQLVEFYKVTNGVPCLDNFDFHACDDLTLFEWWDEKDLWLAQRDFYVIRWSTEKDKFCLGDGGNVSLGEKYEFDSLIELLEAAFAKWNDGNK
jgi:tetratricopeptide (TPR) repeat protein